MVLKLKNKLKPASALISPPTVQSPDPDFFVGHKTFNDGRTIWWSRPQPDKLTIRGQLLEEHFELDEAANDLHSAVWSFLVELSGSGPQLGVAPGYIAKGDTAKKMMEVRLPFGKRGSMVAIRLEQKIDLATKTVSFLMNMEMNPRKLGVEGFKALRDHLHQAGEASLVFHRFLADAWITRVDVAIDYAGVFPSEILLTAKGQGKRADYFGPDGILESTYLHKLKKPPSKPVKALRDPMGRLIAKIYDRNRERLARGKAPPYAGFQVTRLEVVRIDNAKHLTFMALAGMVDVFAGVRLSYAAGLVGDEQLSDWHHYIAVRRSYGPDAAALLSFPNAPVPLQKRYELHGSNLLDGAMWETWKTGLSDVGLGHLILDTGLYLQSKKTAN